MCEKGTPTPGSAVITRTLSLIVSWPAVRSSWQILEGSPDPGGLPRYPIKSLILVAFALLIAQGVAWIIQQVARLRGVPPAEESP